MKIKHWIFGGCSFTYSGLGGVPPSDNTDGGSAFIDYPLDNIKRSNSRVWAEMAADEVGILSSTVNVASASHGNILTSRAILYLLKHYNYNPENTFILFNISDPGRRDIVCDFNHRDESKFIPWTKDIIPFSFKKYYIQKQECFRETDRYTSDFLFLFLEYLKHKKFKFLFTTMSDYSNHPDLSTIINEYQTHFVPCGPMIGMTEYCLNNDLTISKTNFHPTLEGHKKIATIVVDHLYASLA